MARAPCVGRPARVRPSTGALFLHGSNYGTCRAFAAQLADEAAAVGCAIEVAALDEYADHLPTDRPGAPVVMIAACTGLAPLRAAVADRTAARAAELPPALLYFGCDAPDADFLHAGELRAAEAAGAVRLRPAFSAAPENGALFVQHRIAAEADEVWELLTAGARVHVCGDGSRMAPGVRETFRTLYRERTPGADEAAAGRWLDSLMADGRYVEDVYAAG